MDPCLALTDIRQELTRLYPNPVKDKLHIKVADDCEVTVYDALGKLVLNKKIESGGHTINLQTLSQGVYYLQLISAQGTFVHRLIKE